MLSFTEIEGGLVGDTRAPNEGRLKQNEPYQQRCIKARAKPALVQYPLQNIHTTEAVDAERPLQYRVTEAHDQGSAHQSNTPHPIANRAGRRTIR